MHAKHPSFQSVTGWLTGLSNNTPTSNTTKAVHPIRTEYERRLMISTGQPTQFTIYGKYNAWKYPHMWPKKNPTVYYTTIPGTSSSTYISQQWNDITASGHRSSYLPDIVWCTCRSPRHEIRSSPALRDPEAVDRQRGTPASAYSDKYAHSHTSACISIDRHLVYELHDCRSLLNPAQRDYTTTEAQ